MRLVLQCSVCGTIHTVGAAVCITCRASGFQNLRLLFECSSCFRLGLSPSCEECSISVPPRCEEPAKPSIPNAAPHLNCDSEVALLDGKENGDSDFEFTLEELPLAEIDEDLSLDDASDRKREDK